MRKFSFTSFFFVASLVISISVIGTSKSHADIILDRNRQTFEQRSQGPGNPQLDLSGVGSGTIVNMNGGKLAPARNTRPAAPRATPAQRQQQLQGPPEEQRPTVQYDEHGSVILPGDQPGDYAMPTTPQQPMSTSAQPSAPIGDQEGDYQMPTNEQNPMFIGDQEGDYPMPTTPQQSMSGGNKAPAENECDDALESAKTACLFPGTGGMDDGTAAMFSMMMNVQLPTMVTQIASVGKNMGQQCKVQADMNKLMTAINGIKGAACAKMISTCKAACSAEFAKAQTDYKTHSSQLATQGLAAKDQENMQRTRRHGQSCTAYTGQVVGMMMSAMQSGVSMVANQQCEKDFAAFDTKPPAFTPPPVAKVGGCEDPNNTSSVCLCSRPGNATSAMCAGFTGGGGLAGGGSTSTTPNGSTVASPYGPTVAQSDDGNTVDPFANPAKKAGGDGKGQGDGGSGAPGGGGLSSLSSEGGGGGYGGDPKSAITGTSGGTGSGLGGSGGGGGGGSGGLARNNGAAGNGGAGGFFDKFNLKKFLPGSKYKTRGIAGMSVKSVDGITGPMGPSLFEKATRQYQEQIQKQTVILDK